MPNDPNQNINPRNRMIYQIRIKGHLDEQWTDWFSGLTITLEESGDTLLTGPITDQSALFGLLRRVSDLGMKLISFNQMDTDNQD
jgi:hypothetical protein